MKIGLKTERLLLAVAIVLSVAGQQAMAVATIDLRGGPGASGSANGAYFEWVDHGSTGTGNISSFLRIQGNGLEAGYNTDGALEFDTKKSHTRAIQLDEVPIVEKNGTLYREFLLDIQENTSGDSRFLSLDKVEIYLADTGTLTGYPNLGTKVFDLDIGANGDTTVLLDSSLNPGNGWGDAFMYVPISGDNNKFVYLYSEFGGTYRSDAGPEEWAVRVGIAPPPPPPPPMVPVPGALLLVLGGSGLTLSLNRRKQL
jgi:hypothetical protein